MDLLGAEMAAFADALEQGQNQLTLGSEPLPPVVQAAAQGAGLGHGDRRPV